MRKSISQLPVRVPSQPIAGFNAPIHGERIVSCVSCPAVEVRGFGPRAVLEALDELHYAPSWRWRRVAKRTPRTPEWLEARAARARAMWSWVPLFVGALIDE